MMTKKNEYSLGQLKYHGAIINPEKIPDKEDAEKYRKAVDDMFRNLSVIMTIPRKYPEIAEKAYYEVFGKK